MHSEGTERAGRSGFEESLCPTVAENAVKVSVPTHRNGSAIQMRKFRDCSGSRYLEEVVQTYSVQGSVAALHQIIDKIQSSRDCGEIRDESSGRHFKNHRAGSSRSCSVENPI